MADRICFMGRGGSGKSTVAQNLCHALARMGYHVLLVGNDLSLSSTVLLRGDAEIRPALEDYREKYEIDLSDYILATASGVFCLELGSIEPGLGCLARGINLIDEMLDTQGVSNDLQLDYILYDISGETPCTGYILPVREDVMQRCVVVTNHRFASVTAANNILQGVLRASEGKSLPVQLIVNDVNFKETRDELADYAKRTHIDVLAYIDYDRDIEYSALAGKTIFTTNPTGPCAEHLMDVARDLVEKTPCANIKPFTRDELLRWLREWQRKELSRRLALDEVTANG